MTPVTFQGKPPFYLATAQSASAQSVGQIVQMTLYAIVDGQGPMPVPIGAQMTFRTAQNLADALSKAGLEAEVAAR